MSKEYRTSIVAVEELGDDDLKVIVDLYLNYYDGTNASLVLSDMMSKTDVLLLYYEDTLVGFTTFEVYEREWKSKPIKVIYSGDTIVEKNHWGQQALAYAWIRYIGKLKEENQQISIYWFLIVKGHRTFKYLPAFTHTFYPHWSKNCTDLKPLLDSLAKEKFGKYYDDVKSVITFDKSHGHLKENYAYPKENEKRNEAVGYFLERNPGYLHGDELACICSFDDDNLRPLTKRILYPKENIA